MTDDKIARRDARNLQTEIKYSVGGLVFEDAAGAWHEAKAREAEVLAIAVKRQVYLVKVKEYSYESHASFCDVVDLLTNYGNMGGNAKIEFAIDGDRIQVIEPGRVLPPKRDVDPRLLRGREGK